MPARTLTMQSVERLKPELVRRLEVPDAALPGLYLVIQPSGAKSWAIRYRAGNKPRKMTLGPYPLLNLAEARGQAREALQAVGRGLDPAEMRKAVRIEAATGTARNSIAALVPEFVVRHARVKNSEGWAREVERTLDRIVIPAWGGRLVTDIKRRDVVDLLDAVMDRGSPIMANRTLAIVRKFFAWCVGRSEIEISPCSGIKAPGAESSRDRVLSDIEIRAFWAATVEIGWPFGPLFQLLLLTAQRRDEVGQIRRAEIDEVKMLWSIPRQRTKNSNAHDVPLSTEAVSVIATLPHIAGRPGFVFTSNGRTPVSGFSKAKRRVDEIMLKQLREGFGDPDAELALWRLHDLRRTASTGMAMLGQPIHVVEAVLNHRSGTISGVAAVYNRYQYLAEKRAALEGWSRHVNGLCSRDTTG